MVCEHDFTFRLGWLLASLGTLFGQTQFTCHFHLQARKQAFHTMCRRGKLDDTMVNLINASRL